MKRKAEDSTSNRMKKISTQSKDDNDENGEIEENSDDQLLMKILRRVCAATNPEQQLLPIPDSSDNLESFCVKSQALQQAIQDCRSGKTSFLALTGALDRPDYEAQEIASMTHERAYIYRAWQARGAQELADERLILGIEEKDDKSATFAFTATATKMGSKTREKS
ncbi:uncharacterized protein SAPINGB_P003655 [Magnusiomyces paraingens]|uniref:Uncharacterized protein n=1 Tax=Magnusiomyces paraingens TaxID=2606893 RepID=A0A5E8BSR1_9ASCO|nr:uncharacterized protein SAPINGB_P003655 [Saprochaete ingens]VVT53599.1 unnamed protein product [Saprochaete ingens]